MLRRARVLAAGCFVASAAAASGAVLLPTACSRTAAPAPTSPEPLVIGVSLGLTGTLSQLAQPMQNGIRVAEQQINALGGLLGRKVEFRVVDDQSDSTSGSAKGTLLRAAIGSLVDAGVPSILGPIGSQQVTDIQADLYNRRILEISPSATATDLGDAQPATNRYFFRTVPPDDLQGKAIAYFALNLTFENDVDASTGDDGGDAAAEPSTISAACKTMAVVYGNDAYGMGVYNAVKASVGQYGGTVKVAVPLSDDTASSYQSEVNQVLAVHPDCVGVFSYDKVGAYFLRDLNNQLAETPDVVPSTFYTIGSDGLYDQGFITAGAYASGNYTNGTLGTSPDSAPQTPQYEDFRQMYAASFPLEAGVDTGQYVSNSYDAAILVALAVEKAGGVEDPVKLRDALYAVSSSGTSYGPADVDDALRAIRQGEDVDYYGASGPCDFDAEGNVVTSYIVWQVQGGQFTSTPIARIDATKLK